jgi:hypothetical protein
MTRKLCVLVVVCLLALLSLVSCASAPSGDSPANSGTLANSPSVALARAAARIGLSVALQRHGVPAADAAIIMSELRVIVDELLAGEDLRSVLLDSARWEPLRAKVRARFVKILTKPNSAGVAYVDEFTAGVLVDQLIDGFVAVIKPSDRE